jgi:hypothetical protein
VKLIEDAEQAWRWFSVQAMAVAAAVEEGWAQLPDDWKAATLAHVPPNTVHHVVTVLLAVGIAGRLVKQKPKQQGDKAP